MTICSIIKQIKQSYELLLDTLEEILLISNYKLL